MKKQMVNATSDAMEFVSHARQDAHRRGAATAGNNQEQPRCAYGAVSVLRRIPSKTAVTSRG